MDQGRAGQAGGRQAAERRNDSKEWAARRKAAREKYMASLKRLTNVTFIVLSCQWQTGKVVAVCARARAFECGWGRRTAAGISAICARSDGSYAKACKARVRFANPKFEFG